MIIFFWIALAIAVAILASSRGRNGLIWFIIAIIVSPIISGIFVLVMPNLKIETLKKDEEEKHQNETKECPKCAERIQIKAKVCRFCQHALELN